MKGSGSVLTNNMDATYKQNEMHAYRIAVQFDQILKKERQIPIGDWQQRLREIEQQMQTKKFRMAVVGEFNRGKSSFINGLLGKKILPEDVLAATATINRVTYGEKPKAYLIMKDHGQRTREIPVEDLASYVTKLTSSSAKAAAEIREAVIEYPTMLCYNDVDVIDTPGMNDMDDMNAVTVNQLEDIDLAVVVVDAQYPYSETENRFVVKLLENRMICQIIFVITHFDQIRDREKPKLYEFLYSRIQTNVLEELRKRYQPEERIFQKYHVIFDHLHLYGVSSPDVMEAFEVNNMELYEKSGFLQISKDLPQIILSSRSVHMIDNIVSLLEEMIGEYESKIKMANSEWEQMVLFWQDCIYLCDTVVQEMDELAADEFMDRFTERKEDQEKDIVKKLLHSLGDVRELTFDALQKAMVPVMHQEFERMNLYYQNCRNQILDSVIQKWRFVLSRFADYVKNKAQQCPGLMMGLQAENEKIFKLPYRLFMRGFVQFDPYIFGWSDNPVYAVLNTQENQSVLPEFQRIVKESIDICLTRMECELKNAFTWQIAEIKKNLEAYIGFLKTYIDQQKSCARDDTALLSDLGELQKDCRNLHETIRREIKKERSTGNV